MAASHPDFQPLYDRLGYTFTQRELLIEALTHQSATSAVRAARHSYERLEFLGDRVLGLVVAQMLFAEFPDDDVGALARRHVDLVRAEALAHVAATLDLPKFILVSQGESRAGARDSNSIQSDIMEAVLAAIYLDGGIAAARDVVARHWGKLMRAQNEPPRDPKTALQEWLQARNLKLPRYRVANRKGPAHEPVFTIEVIVDGSPPITADGPNKKSAEIAAAAAMLEQLTASE